MYEAAGGAGINDEGYTMSVVSQPTKQLSAVESNPGNKAAHRAETAAARLAGRVRAHA